MAALTRRQQVAFVATFAVYALIVVPLGVRKGDDITTEIAQAHRILDGLVLYHTPQTQGIWWPPFALLVVVPFAALADASLALAKACWGVLGIVALAWSVHECGRRWGWRPALVALAVVLFPVHNNFHHLNFETILLALLVAAAADLTDGRDARAGVWVGLATALKIFPGLLLPYFAWRRQWKAFGAGVAVAAGVTVLALLPYGPGGALEALGNFVTLTIEGQNFQGGTIVGFHMQKLGRLGYAIGGGGAPASIAALHLLAASLVLATLARRPAPPARPADDPPLEVGIVILLAVLVTPIAWLHTFTLGYLAWVAAVAYPPLLSGTARTAWRASLWIVAIHASTAASSLPLPAVLRFFTMHNDTIGALLVLGLLLWQRTARSRAPLTILHPGSPQPV
jgi:alpha-1,2-mannosyltransferase